MAISFPAVRANHKDELEVDIGLIRVLHPPGHAPIRLSYSVNVAGKDRALFTGGSLLFGSVGRPDLLGPELTEPLARAQWASMRSIAAQQLLSNPVFTTDEEDFVAELIAGLDAFPVYYAHMGPANQAGAGPIDLSLPQLATPQDISRRIAAGEWVVDLRHRRLFAGEHVKGSLSFDVHGNAVTYLGWMIDWGTPITLLGDDPVEVQTMQRELVRIGIDRPAAFAVGGPETWASSQAPLSGYRRANHVDMAAAVTRNPELPMLDLRRNSEFDNGYVAGAKHVPLHELRGRLDEVVRWAHENREPVWIYCGSGFRASAGASPLEASSVDVVHVDDDFANAEKAGLTIIRPSHGHRLGGTYTD